MECKINARSRGMGFKSLYQVIFLVESHDFKTLCHAQMLQMMCFKCSGPKYINLAHVYCLHRKTTEMQRN